MDRRLPRTIDIAVLADGRVVFCDLPPDLAEVRDVLAGAKSGTKTASPRQASEPPPAAHAGAAVGESRA